MFNLFSSGNAKATAGAHPVTAPGGRPARKSRPFRAIRLWPTWCVLLVAGAGCRLLAPPLPPADLHQPGWTVLKGQAVWRLPHAQTELAGDLVLGMASDGRAYVQFTKSPFPLLVAQENLNQWEVSFPSQNKHYSGRGAPPKRLMWLYLPRILKGAPPPKGWVWRRDANRWHLENPKTGESVEGFFAE